MASFYRTFREYYRNDWSLVNQALHEFDLKQNHDEKNIHWNISYNDFKLIGRIDSIWQTKKLTIITFDYKRNYSPPKKEAELGIAPQLAFYAKAISQISPFKLDHTILGYWEILKGKWVPIAAGGAALDYLVSNKLISKSANILDINTFINSTENMWKWRQELIRDQKRFAADPSQCKLCDYAGICRKEDESYKDRFEKKLEQKLKTRGKIMSADLEQHPQNPYNSFIVSASAGCGKTYQLSRRFLFLVAAGAKLPVYPHYYIHQKSRS